MAMFVVPVYEWIDSSLHAVTGDRYPQLYDCPSRTVALLH